MTSAGRQAILDLTPEDDLQDMVIKAARANGWYVHHDPPTRHVRGDGSVRYRTAMQGDPGFPDLVLARDGEVIVVEMKALHGRFRPGQKEWLAALGAKVCGPREVDSLVDRLARPRPKVPRGGGTSGG